MRLRRLIAPALALAFAGSCSSSEGLGQLGEPLDRRPPRPRRLQMPDPAPPPAVVQREAVKRESTVVVATLPTDERVAVITPRPTPVAPTPVVPTVPEVRVPELDCTARDAVGYRKGRRIPIKLVTVDGSPVERVTANAFWAMTEAAAKDGVGLTIYSAFRSPEEQEYFYQCFLTCSCNGCSRAAKPGFSNHQMGRAVDIAIWSPEVHPWLVANAKKFGFSATVPDEPWHWEFRGKPRKPAICK